MRTTLTRDDDYASLGKPPCDWDDPKAREALVDALVRDAHAALEALCHLSCDDARRQRTILFAFEFLRNWARANRTSLKFYFDLGCF